MPVFWHACLDSCFIHSVNVKDRNPYGVDTKFESEGLSLDGIQSLDIPMTLALGTLPSSTLSFYLYIMEQVIQFRSH